MIFMSKKRFEYEIEKRMTQAREIEFLHKRIDDMEQRFNHRIERMDCEIDALRHGIEEMKGKLDIPFFRDPITHPSVTWQTPSTANGPYDCQPSSTTKWSWTGIDPCSGESTTTCIKDDSNTTYTGQMKEE